MKPVSESILLIQIALLFGGAACTGGKQYVGFDAGEEADGQTTPIDGDETPIDAPSIDAPIDAMPGTWSQPEAVAFNVNDKTETMANAAPSGTELFFAAPPAGETYILDVYYVTRSNPANDWGATRTAVGAVNTTDMETEPVISVDGLEMIFRRSATLYTSKRASTGSAWGAATSTGLTGSFPDLLADNLTMYYRDSSATCNVDTCRVRVSRSSPTSAWGNAVVEEIHDGGTYQHVDISGDGLRALLSGPSMAGVSPVAIASRATRDDPWGPAEVITELALYTGIRWAHWSWDETEMYLGFSTGGNDIYVSRYEQQ